MAKCSKCGADMKPIMQMGSSAPIGSVCSNPLCGIPTLACQQQGCDLEAQPIDKRIGKIVYQCPKGHRFSVTP